METNTNRRPSIVPTERYILRIRNVATNEVRVKELDLNQLHLESLQSNVNRNLNGFRLEALIRKVGNQ